MGKTPVWQGDASIRDLLVPISSISTHPENARRGDVKRIGESLLRFGQTRPIVVQKSSGHILAGNHTYRAAVEELSWTHIAVVTLDVDDATALAYLVADNRLSDLGDYDWDAQIALLNRLQDAAQLAGTGFTPDEIDDEIARLRLVAETAAEDFRGDFSETEETRAAREAARAAAPIMREVLLMLEPERYAAFGGYVRIVQKELGINTVTDAIYETVKRAALAANQGDADADADK